MQLTTQITHPLKLRVPGQHVSVHGTLVVSTDDQLARAPLSEATKAQISEKLEGKPKSEATEAKLSQSHKRKQAEAEVDEDDSQ